MKFCTSLTLLFIAFLINALPGFGQEDLKISVTASHINADPGDEITYVIKYMNAGLTTASDVIITSQLPDMETYTYVSSNPQGVVLGNEITWNQSQIPELALLSNGERQITVTVKAGIPGSGDSQYSSGYYIPSATAILNSYATIKSNSTVIPLHSNTVSTTIVQNYSVHINNASGVIKSATGTTIYYMIQVSNNGNVYDRYDLSSLNYDCDGPGGKDYDKLSASFTDLNGNTITKTDWIEPDQAYFFLLKLTAPKGTNPGKWSCHDVIATSSASGYSGVGKIQTQTDGAPHYPLVSLSKIDDKDPVEAGELLNYTIYAFNSNDTYAANNFIIKETYPPNVSFVSSTPAPDPGGDNQWSLGNLEYGLAGAKTINITLRVNSLSNCGGIITNTVSASYDGCDASNPPQATVVTTIKSYPDLVISKTAKLSSTPARKGESITYTLSYQNIGSCDAPNSLIKDLFDEVHTNIVNAGGGTQSGSEISWTLGTLTPGQSGSITYSALIDPGSKFNPGTTIITNKAIISTSENESNLNNNTSIASIPVSVLPDMKVEVLSEKMIMEPGKQNTYTLKISNIGDIAASNVEIKNQLPTGLNVGFISDGGVNLDGFIAWPVISTFEVGSSVEYQVKITPSCSFIPSITSITTVTSSIIDKDESNNSVTVHSVVQDITEPVLADIPTDMTTGCENIPAVGTPKASDNCDSTPVIHYLGEVSTRGTDPLLPDYYNYTLTRSWDASDASGNHSMPGTQVITVKDIVPPLMPVLQDVTVGECSGTPTAPTTTDICKGTLIGTPSTVFPITQQGTTVVTWTFDDGNGNVTTANQNVIVDDVTHPVPDMASLPDATGECSVTVTAPTATDNCKGKITATTTDPFTYSAQGTYTIHWTYDDGNGNTSSQTQTVVVDDVTAPVADITDLPVITGECSATITAPTSTDNCKGKITATTTDPLTYSAQGTYTIHWIYNDGNGNTSTQTQSVVVDDITPPEKPILADITVGECSGTPMTPTTTDNCSEIITGTTSTIFPITQQGTTIVTWSFDDGNGNVITANQNVILDDVTPPVADVTNLPDAVGECSVTVTVPTSTDNCKGKITATTTDPLTYSAQGSYTIHWMYDDGNGNTSSQTQNVVVDNIAPPMAPILADVTIGECSGTPLIPTITNNCSGVITGTTSTVFPITQQGTTIVTWTFDDGNGNVTSAIQNLILDDITAPVADITDLPIITGECSATVTAPTATDNCKGKITATTTDPLTYSAQGSYTIHWMYDDGNGNTSGQVQSVVVDDITPPEKPMLADVNVGECSGTLIAPTATDNCNGIITGTTSTVFPITQQGPTIVTWSFDDGNGNVITANQNVIVADVTPPVADMTNLPDATGECSVTVIAPTATDNCKGKITATTTDLLTYSAQGSYTIHWIYDDGNGNTSSQTQSVVVDDITPPEKPMLADITVGECSGTPIAPTTTDNCSEIITGTTSTIFPITQQGTTIVTWSFDDGNGNVTTANQNVIVDDVTPPVADITDLPVITGECSATVTAPTATDNCKGKITATTTDPLTYSAQGSYTIHWMYDDGNGNTSSQTQSVVVDDITPPEKPILADVTVGECSGIPIAPTATDNCNGIITGTTPTAFPITQQGTTVVTWTFDDGNGNVTTAKQNVIVDDVTPPVADITDLPVITGECSATITAPTSTDNCKGKITAITTDPLTYSAQGTYTIHWIYDDGNGNTSTQMQSVAVDDVTPPEKPILADVNVGECSGTPIAPTATDNCNGIITGITSTAFPITQQGTTVVTWTFDDGNGNVTTANQNVILDDITAPVADVASLPTITGECSVTVIVPTATDNCKGKITATTTDPFTYSAQGSYTIHWMYDDGNGNTSSQTQTVMVDDVTAPVADITDLPVITGECSATVTAPTATDNCKGKITATTTDPLTYSAQGSYTIHWMYDDGNGNTSSQLQSVVVDDITPPEKPILADITVGECSGTPIAPTTTDNCNGIITGTTSTVFPITQQGKHTIIWTFDDGNGNVTSANQNLILDDITAPVADITDLPVITGECSVIVTAPTATDNCKGKITATTTDPLTYSAQGSYTIHWMYDDGNGNTSSQTQTVVVDDVTAPVADITDLPVITGECSATATAPTASDNCKGKITATTTDPVTYSAQGSYTIHWMYDDGNGNTSSQMQSVVVDDITPPEKPILADVNVEECSGTPIAPTTTDNCSEIITGTTTTVFPITQQGTTVVTWTFDDSNGNVTTANQNVILDDITAPVADITDLPIITGECSVTVTVPTATDNCKGKITATTTDPLTYSAQGTYTIHWMYDDGNGNTSTQTQTVEVDDITPPEKPILADITVGECSGTPIAPTTTDNCSEIITGTTTTVFPITQQGTTVVTWTFNDGNGNVTTAKQNVIVDDITAPVADITDLPVITGECSATVTVPTATDNCKGKITATTTDPLTYSAQGSYTIHWIYDDGNGNTSTQTQSVVVDDVTPPETPILADVFLGECTGTPPIPTTMDNCSGIVKGTTSILFPKTIQGKHTILWTFDDGNGNVTTAYQNLILDDITAPVADITDLPVITGECSATVTAPTATDNCKGKITATTTDPLTYSAQGSYTIHWIYDDGNGNTSSQTQSVVVNDITAPVADVTDLPDANGECSVIVITAPTATDNCKGKITATTTDPLTYSAQGSYTIHWMYDDGNGNTSSQTQTLIVDDITAPVADITDLPVITGECSATVTAPTATDNCKGKITATTTDPLTYSAQGSYTIHWMYDDGNGNTSTQMQSVAVDDLTPPEKPILADITVGECSGTPIAPTTTDNCSEIITGTTTTVFPITQQGTTVVTWTFNDGNGNVTTAKQNVILDDVTPPVADITDLPVITGECSATVTAPTATDNCKGKITATTTDPLTYSAQGSYTIHWIYDDGNGNTSSQTQTVVVDDVTAPVADITELPEITGECSATVTAPTATDNCKEKISATTTDPLTYSAQGSYTIHWMYDDGNGNSSSQLQTVLVDDITPPDTPVLADVNIGECSGIPIAPTTTDNCNGIITGTTSTIFPITQQGTTIVTWTFDDGNGNVTTAYQNLILDDITAPVADITDLPVITGECSVTVTAPTATDNCKGKITATTTDPLTYSAQGSYTIHWIYDDGNGNTSSQTQSVVVDDVTPPETPILEDVFLGECTGTPPIPTTMDNCSGIVKGTTSILFPKTKQGKHTIIWTFDDGNGNVTTAYQNLILDDITAPVPDIASLPEITGECSATVTAPTATDNCKGKITATTTDPLTYSAQGTYTIHWMYDDGNGNTSTQTQSVVVDDVTPPETPILADVFLGECTGTPPIPTTMDNCSGIVKGTTSILFPKTKQGKHTIIWTFDDGNGNVTTAYQNLILDDITAPVPDIASLPEITGECSATVTAPTATDNCKGKITATTTDPLTYSAQGTYTIHWMYDDGNGNTSSQTQSVVVNDITPPVADTNDLPVITGECSATVTVPISTDNCKGKITATTTDPLTYSAQGSYTIHWIYDDGNGNTSTQTQSVVVDDITPPEKPILADITVGECSGTPIAPTATDNCSEIITGTTTTVFPITQQGTTVVTWSFDDGNGNVTTANQNVIVDDVTAPIPDMASLPEATGECSATVTAPTATDNCKGKITATTTDPLTYSAQGSYTIHWIYDDGNGNTSTQTQSVVVNDITPPEIKGTIAALTVDGCSVEEVTPAVNTVAALEAMGLFINDGCTEDALLTVTSKDVSNGEIPVTVTRTYTIKDVSNNSTNYVQTIVVTDTQKPTIECLADLNVTVDAGNCNVTNLLLGVPIANDNCSISSVSNDAPSIFGLGTTVVTWTVSDKSGNTATCQQNVIVDGSPVAIDDKIVVDENSQVTGNVMANDLGLCDNSVQMQIVSEPQFGSLTSASNGNFEYIPQDKYSGLDMFTYQICDRDGDCSTATVEITVNNGNDLPLAVADTENLQVDITLNGNVAANDILSHDGDNLWALVNPPSNGTINFNQDGTYTYAPHFDFIGNDNFSYELCDSNGDCSTAMVTIVVEDVLIPNQILTPNADDHNDTFIIKGIEYYPTNKVTIYNRWGNIVYKKNNYQNEWDGYSNVSKVGSKSLPLGTYFYLIDYANNRHKTGFVYLDK